VRCHAGGEISKSSTATKILSSAERYHRKEVADLEACFRNDHFLTNILKALLADILQAEDKLVEATRLYREVLESRQRNTYPGHLLNVSAIGLGYEYFKLKSTFKALN
jgi:hypothetical protein